MLRLLLAAVLLLAPGASAQESTPQPDAAPAWDDLPPAMQLGIRAEGLRRQREVIPELVIVHDEVQFALAIAGWRPRTVFPILIDDGSAESRENIARFSRAFSPARVVRWEAEAEPDIESMRSLATRSLAASWNLAQDAEIEGPPPQRAILAHWKSLGITPPGVIVTSENDQAWPAALTLAAARAQPILWIGDFLPQGRENARARNVNAAMELEDALELATFITQGCTETGLTWDSIGDAIDAITLCLNVPTKIQFGEGPRDVIATTDRIGRHAGDDDPNDRYAWTGQIFGSHSEAAYRAMCGIFLQPDSAIILDTYPTEDPWILFDGARAGAALRQRDIDTEVLAGTEATEVAWRRRCMSPVDADFVMINSMGNADVFALSEGEGLTGDTPLLTRPAIVNCVHSWSASRPGARNTIAGRWFERGAYAYVGSVQEPFLQAFVPTPQVAARLASAAPLAAAVRHNAGKAWRINVLADPLITFGPAAARITANVPLKDVTDVSADLEGQLRGEEYVSAVETLLLLGRDDDIARLLSSLLAEHPEKVTSELAQVALPAVARAGSRDNVGVLFQRLEPGVAREPAMQDLLWLAWGPAAMAADDEIVELLAHHLRGDQLARDAIEAAGALARVRGNQAAVGLLRGVLPSVQKRKETRAVEAALNQYGG